MGDRTRVRCQNCGAHRDNAGDISWSGLCSDCGRDRLIENLDGLHTRSGIPWQRWRFGYTRFLLGDEIANALYRARLFDVPLDEAASGR